MLLEVLSLGDNRPPGGKNALHSKLTFCPTTLEPTYGCPFFYVLLSVSLDSSSMVKAQSKHGPHAQLFNLIHEAQCRLCLPQVQRLKKAGVKPRKGSSKFKIGQSRAALKPAKAQCESGSDAPQHSNAAQQTVAMINADAVQQTSQPRASDSHGLPPAHTAGRSFLPAL